MTAFDEFSQRLLADLKEGCSFKKQILEKSPAVQFSGAQKLAEYLKGETDDSCRVILLDLAAYENFEKFFEGLVNAVYEDPGFSPEDTGIAREAILNSASVFARRKRFQSVLSLDFAPKGIRLVFILVHYELASARWTEGDDFGYMRSLLDDVPGMSAVVFTDRSMSEVSDEPVGGSAFWNIFSVPPLEISYE